MALARGQVLAVLPLLPDKAQQQQSPAETQQCYLHSSKHEYTALAWFGQLQSRRSGTGQRRQQQQQHQAEQQQEPGSSPAETYQSLLEAEVLLSGTADGYLQIHSATGQLLYKQRLFGSAVMDILIRPHCSGGQGKGQQAMAVGGAG